jgi:hypothetical protein
MVDSGGEILALLDSCMNFWNSLVGCLDNQVEGMVNATKTHIQFYGQFGYCSKHGSSIVCVTEPGGG